MNHYSNEFHRYRSIAIYFPKRRYELLRRSVTRYFRICEGFDGVQKAVHSILNIGSLRRILLLTNILPFKKTHGDETSLPISTFYETVKLD